ncbi:hypothetical protein QFZ63_006440 [Streptomyces sp. B3I7]|nr:hypothetical protein [Streptomyces sp. B3I7]
MRGAERPPVPPDGSLPSTSSESTGGQAQAAALAPRGSLTSPRRCSPMRVRSHRPAGSLAPRSTVRSGPLERSGRPVAVGYRDTPDVDARRDAKHDFVLTVARALVTSSEAAGTTSPATGSGTRQRRRHTPATRRISPTFARSGRKAARQAEDAAGASAPARAPGPFESGPSEGRTTGRTSGQAPFCRCQKKPSFFGEYDTRRFFVCWWYTPHPLLTCGNGWNRPMRSRVGPSLVRITEAPTG